MNLKPNERRKIEGASAVETCLNDVSTEATNESATLNFPVCPREYQEFIHEASLEDLVFWKLNHLFADGVESNALKSILAQVEKPLFAITLKKTKGNQSKAADILGCNRNTLHRKLKEFYVEPRHLRKVLKHSKPKNAFRSSEADSSSAAQL